MKKVLLIAILIAAYAHFSQSSGILSSPVAALTSQRAADADGAQRLAIAFEQHQSNIQVEGHGAVSRILPDDLDGSRHQRFIVQLANGQTILIAHNIDLAPRVDDLAEGDQISFYGEYEWSQKGGVVHWTHHDPAGQHESGWIKRNGNTYQ